MVDSEYIDKIIEEIKALPEDACKERIESTKSELEGYNYSPLFTLDVPNFFTTTKEDILKFVRSISENRRNEIDEEDLSLIVYHYKLLQRLRCNDPESWDHVTELMDED